MKGKLIIIGGAEDKGTESDSDFTRHGILKRFLDETGKGEKSRIEIVTTASTVPEEIGSDYIKAFRKLDATNTGTLHIASRDEADDPKTLKRLERADAIFVTGGDQLRLTPILGGTRFYVDLLERLRTDRNFIYAGTSAGAAAASENMIFEGNATDAILKGEVQTAAGFGLIRDVVFDTHFITRGRIGRLFQIIVTNPKLLGVGLEENTGLLIHNGKMEAIGPGMTIIVDGHDIKNHNCLKSGTARPFRSKTSNST
jgi:cyanophycinase